jgi:hypothetical protein
MNEEPGRRPERRRTRPTALSEELLEEASKKFEDGGSVACCRIAVAHPLGAGQMNASGRKVYPYSASVTYRNPEGQEIEEAFPVWTTDRAAASDLAVAYVLNVLKLQEFEIRIVGG